MSEQEIRRALKKNGVTELNALMRGEFVPFMPSSSIKKTVRQNQNELPMSELYEIKAQLQGRKLGEPETPQPEPRTEAPVSQAPAQTVQPVAAVATPPATAQAGAVPAPSSAPAPNTQSTLALLSSGNPIDALKNLQIFQRQQQ